jgi:hypothetical protein
LPSLVHSNNQERSMPNRKSKNHHPDGGATDQVGIGPTDIDGAEASELPDKGRGPVETNPGKELRRKTPAQTGGTVGGDVGIEATPDVADARDHGGRKRN